MSERDRDEELLAELASAMRTPERTPSQERVDALRKAAARQRDRGASGSEPAAPAAPERPAGRTPRRRSGFAIPAIRPAFALAATALALAGGYAAGASIGGGDETATVAGVVEYDGPITLGNASGELTVTMTGIGRVVELDTRDLPILPKGEYYEVWFIGPGDSRESPNRIAAGTFHPAPDGRSDVTFAAAVDPKLYPVVSVTAEPGNGNPLAAGREVLRERIG